MMNERIADFLAQGMTPTQVYSIVGCAPALINELIKDPTFMEAVKEKSTRYLQEADEDEIVTNKYLSLEHKILKKIEVDIGNADIRDAIRALEVVGNRQEKRMSRKTAPTPNANPNINIAILNLPAHTIPEYVMNANKEVVAINNKAMTPMSSAGVKQMFDTMKLTGNKEVEVLASK